MNRGYLLALLISFGVADAHADYPDRLAFARDVTLQVKAACTLHVTMSDGSEPDQTFIKPQDFAKETAGSVVMIGGAVVLGAKHTIEELLQSKEYDVGDATMVVQCRPEDVRLSFERPDDPSHNSIHLVERSNTDRRLHSTLDLFATTVRLADRTTLDMGKLPRTCWHDAFDFSDTASVLGAKVGAYGYAEKLGGGFEFRDEPPQNALGGLSTANSADEPGTAALKFKTYRGMSGGPVLDSEDRLIGVVYGRYDGHWSEGLYVPVSKFGRWLDGLGYGQPCSRRPPVVPLDRVSPSSETWTPEIVGLRVAIDPDRDNAGRADVGNQNALNAFSAPDLKAPVDAVRLDGSQLHAQCAPAEVKRVGDEVWYRVRSGGGDYHYLLSTSDLQPFALTQC